ncbi:hypothetical protein ALCH109712_11650 [Alkalicoccus chagannorensis]
MVCDRGAVGIARLLRKRKRDETPQGECLRRLGSFYAESEAVQVAPRLCRTGYSAAPKDRRAFHLPLSFRTNRETLD